MPAVLRFDGLRIVICPNDHRPAHVHVIGVGKEATFTLHCPNGPPRLNASYGFERREVNRISQALDQTLELLCKEWRKIHGRY